MRILLKGRMNSNGFSQTYIDMIRGYIEADDELLLKCGKGGILDFIWKTIDVMIAVNEEISEQDIKKASSLKLVLTFDDKYLKDIKTLLKERKIRCVDLHSRTEKQKSGLDMMRESGKIIKELVFRS